MRELLITLNDKQAAYLSEQATARGKSLQATLRAILTEQEQQSEKEKENGTNS